MGMIMGLFSFVCKLVVGNIHLLVDFFDDFYQLLPVIIDC